MIPAGLCAGVSALAVLWPCSDRWLWALLPWGAFFLSRYGPALTQAIPHNHRRWVGPGFPLVAWALFGAVLTRVVVGVVAGPWDVLASLSR